MLHTLAQLHKVLQDVFGSSFLATDVAASNCAQQIPVEQKASCMACWRIWTGFAASSQVACTEMFATVDDDMANSHTGQDIASMLYQLIQVRVLATLLVLLLEEHLQSIRRSLLDQNHTLASAVPEC